MKIDPRHLPKVPTSEAEPVFLHDSILGESPVWDERENVLYWVDIDRGEIHRFDPATRANTTQVLPTKVTSIAKRRAGGLITSLKKNIAYFDPATGGLEMLDLVEGGQPENRFNDGKVDRQGRFWAGTMNEVQIGQPDAALYRFDRPGQVAAKIPGVTISNGTGWSPDGRTMYYTDTLRYTVFAYDFDPESGEIANRRVFYETDPAAEGLPDGLTVDADGGVWSALVNYGRMLRFSPDGELERMITFPPTRGTCCTFGGRDFRELYLTTARECLTPGQILAQPLAGSLFHAFPGCQGLAEPYFFA
jgi:sugar lactone lactonase YvrE